MADGDIYEQYENRTSSYLIWIPCISHSISFHILLLRSRLGVGGKVSQEIFKWNSALVIDYKLTLREEFLVVNCSPENNAYLPHWDKEVEGAKANGRELLPQKWEDTTRKCLTVACTLGWEMHCTRVSGR